MLSFMSAKEAAQKWNISQRRVSVLCGENRSKGARMVGNMWSIPSNANKPDDKRIIRSDKKDKYTVTIEETISEDFTVYAKSIEEAIEIAESNYENGIFVLSPGNLISKQIYAENGKGEVIEWHEF